MYMIVELPASLICFAACSIHSFTFTACTQSDPNIWRMLCTQAIQIPTTAICHHSKPLCCIVCKQLHLPIELQTMILVEKPYNGSAVKRGKWQESVIQFVCVFNRMVDCSLSLNFSYSVLANVEIRNGNTEVSLSCSVQGCKEHSCG